MKRGFIKLWRKIKDDPVFDDPVLLKLFVLCLIKANHKPNTVILEKSNEPVKVETGQFITGRNSLHSEFYPRQKRGVHELSPLTIWRKLFLLQRLKILNIETNNRFSIVSVVNWHIYQGRNLEVEQETEQQMNNRRTSDEQRMITNKNVLRNNKNEKESPNSPEKSEKIFSDSSGEIKIHLPKFESVNDIAGETLSGDEVLKKAAKLKSDLEKEYNIEK